MKSMGGPGNPPDKTGYRVITLSANDDEASQQLTAARDAGFEVVTMFVSATGIARVILRGN
jgi:hypothetical protein